MTFRSRLFLASLLTSAVTLIVAAGLVSWSVRRLVDERIERALVNQARLAAETLARWQPATPGELDAEADAIGRLVSARVTFIGPDGTVVGDSELSADELGTLENHATRPEVLQARREGIGVARRYSDTVKTNMLYVAVKVRNPSTPSLSEVRLALPLTEIGEQLAVVRQASVVALTVGFLTALAVAWAASALLSRRVRAIAEMAERYAAGDLSPVQTDYGTDEIGIVARVLDDSMREIGSRVSQRETDRARMDLSSARIGVNVGEREVLNLPINGRQMSQLMLQAPGSVNSGTGTWQDVRFSGRAIEQNAIRYDGVEGSSIIDSAPGNLNGEIPTPFKLQASLENVQEFRVESSNYPAEFGTGTGGQVNVVTKSGTNSVHGSVFEYLRNDAFDAPNYFDDLAHLPKSTLKQNQYGGSVGGPFMKNKAFFFGSYEGYQLDAGVNFVEGVPSDLAWARAVPAVAGLRPGFKSPDAVILPGASKDPDFDIAQLQGLQRVRENAFSLRLDYKLSDRWSMYGRGFHDAGKNNQPEGVSGRTVRITDNPSNAVFNLQGLLTDRVTNELKIGYNAAPTRIDGIAPTVAGADFSNIVLNLSGSVANTGIAGQGANSGIVVPGGLVRANSATNGRGQPYDPYTISLIDSLTTVRGNHFLKAGGEIRAVRLETDRLGGITYTFANVSAFMVDFLKWALTEGQKFAPDLGYAPLPKDVVDLEMKAIPKIKLS